MKKFKFTSTYIIEAKNIEQAKENFTDNSYDFVAKAKCEEIKKKTYLFSSGKYESILKWARFCFFNKNYHWSKWDENLAVNINREIKKQRHSIYLKRLFKK